MDSSTSSSVLWNESDLRLSTSLYQWAGFELDKNVPELNLSSDLTTNKESGGNGSLLAPLSPCNDGENAGEMFEIVREFLLEETSQFYNDVMNAQEDKCAKTGINVASLRKRYDTLCSQTANILQRFHTASIDEEVNNRLKSIDVALSQMSPTKTPASATFSISSSDSGRSSTDELRATASGPLHHWRHWIETMEGDMCRLGQWIDWNNVGMLEQRLKAQQALQSQIKEEGGYWVTQVQRYIDLWPSSNRRKIFSSSVERRWHALWIKSLEWQCRLERQIRAVKLGIVDSNGEEADMGEPLAKRRRVSYDCTISELFTKPSDLVRLDGASGDTTSDSIPSSDSEYKSICSNSTGEIRQEEEGISARDGGYSSAATTCDDEALPVAVSVTPLPPDPPHNSPTCGAKRRRANASRRSGSISDSSVNRYLRADELSEDENSPSRLRVLSSSPAAGDNIDQSLLLSDSRSPKRSTSLRRVLYRSWPIQLCLCVVVCLNMFYFYPSCCERINRYWWSLGLKTYYSNGPPPT